MGLALARSSYMHNAVEYTQISSQFNYLSHGAPNSQFHYTHVETARWDHYGPRVCAVWPLCDTRYISCTGVINSAFSRLF